MFSISRRPIILSALLSMTTTAAALARGEAPQPLPEPAELTVNVEATGRILCGGQPLSDLPVELWDSDARGSHLSDDQLASGVTATDGTFHLRGSGGDVTGRPDLYLRAVYGAPVEGFAPDGTRFESRVDVEDELARTRYDATDVHDEQFHMDFGDVELQTFSGDCNVFRETREVVRDWHLLMSQPFPAPGAEARILRWHAVDSSVGLPHTMYDIVKLPTDLASRPGLRRTLFHELGHVIWFSIHSDHTHWVADMGGFVYGRFHNLGYHARDARAACNTRWCAEGFAMSEGFAHFWERRSLLPARITFNTYTPLVVPADPTQEWEYEGNVRNRLLFLASCLGDGGLGYAKLVRTGMRPIPLHSIHSLPDFEAYALGDHPELERCIGRNTPNLCGRVCRTASDCGANCPRCVPVWMGDVQVSQCVGASTCGQGCRTNADCADPACGTCTPVWYGDVAASECR